VRRRPGGEGFSLYDRPTTLFYVDPPYYGLRQNYAATFAQGDHERLAESLLATLGVWILSYNDHPAVRRLYKGCHFRRLTAKYYISSKGCSDARELLISNRPLRKTTHS